MVTSVIELADKLYSIARRSSTPKDEKEYWLALSRVCANAADMQLPLSVVEQLLKGTDYEQLVS